MRFLSGMSHRVRRSQRNLKKIVDYVLAVENREKNVRESVGKIEAVLAELTFRRIEQGPSSSNFRISIRFNGHFPFTVSSGTENGELEVASVQYRSNVPSFLCYGHAELCSLLTCLSHRHAATGTNTSGYLQQVCWRESSVSRTGQPFSQVSHMALEQINADSKSCGGVIGISQSP